MEAKHTPGPWFALNEFEGYCITDGPDEESKVLTTYSKVDRKYSVTKKQAKANAKLMAAAPELLESLIDIIPFASEWINDNHPAMQKAKSVIKKATE